MFHECTVSVFSHSEFVLTYPADNAAANNKDDGAKKMLALPEGWARPILLMNPATMSACGLVLCSPVVVNHRNVLYSWPDASLPLGSVKIKTRSIDEQIESKIGEFLIVYPVRTETTVNAKELVIRPRYTNQLTMFRLTKINF